MQLMQAADGAREELRHRVRLRLAGRGRQRIAPILRTDDLAGAVWIPGDGKANPTDLTQSLAKGARHARRAESSKACKVTGVRTRRRPRHRRRVAERRRRRRDHAAKRWSTAAASGRANSAALAGVNVPLYSAEHFYIVTKPIAGVTPDAAGDSRSRRLHLLQGGSRRPRDGRLRAGRQAVERAAAFRTASNSSCCRRTGTSSRS